jgi:hypothetical protein
VSSVADIISDINWEIDDCEHQLWHALTDMRSAIAHEPTPASGSDKDYYDMLSKADVILSALRSYFATASDALSDALHELSTLG